MEEKTMLTIVEEVPLIEHALKVFGEQKLAQIIMAIVAINSRNRIAISTKKQTVNY